MNAGIWKTLGAQLATQMRTYTMVIALLVIWFIFQWQTEGAFLQPVNISNLLRQMAITGILAAGMVLVIVAGQIDLSVGSVVAFLGAVLAVLTVQKQWAPLPAFIITLCVGILIGVLQGYLVSYQRIPAFIVTLGGMMGFRGATMWMTQNSTVTLNENWLLSLGTAYLAKSAGWIVAIITLVVVISSSVRSRMREKSEGLDPTSLPLFVLQLAALTIVIIGAMSVFQMYEGVPFPVLIMLVTLSIIHVLATRTVWGRHVYAMGGNPEAAYLSGIPVRQRMVSIFALMGLLAAIGGAVLAARVGSASPDSGQLLELDAIAACVIGGTSLMGGRGSVFGAILGALVIESLNNGMSLANMEPFWQYILKGSVLILAVWFDIASQKK